MAEALSFSPESRRRHDVDPQKRMGDPPAKNRRTAGTHTMHFDRCVVEIPAEIPGREES